MESVQCVCTTSNTGIPARLNLKDVQCGCTEINLQSHRLINIANSETVGSCYVTIMLVIQEYKYELSFDRDKFKKIVKDPHAGWTLLRREMLKPPSPQCDRPLLPVTVHFAADVWERPRVDGKRKLKITAVPTIFANEAKEISYSENLLNKVGCNVERHQYATSQSTETEVQDIDNEKENNNCEKSPPLNNDSIIQDMEVMERKLNKQQRIIRKRFRIMKQKSIKLRYYRDRLVTAQHIIKTIKMKKKRNEKKFNYIALVKNIQRIFTSDLIRALTNNRKMQKWNNKSIEKALRLRFTCGVSGYEELRRQHFPLPGLRTLQRKIEHFKYDSGISDDVFNFFKAKISNWSEIDKECCLVFDETSISSGRSFDTSSQNYIGDVTFPEHTEPKQLDLQ
ncbi:uncharacterized protein [Cardiocondyla obscurior]|uniref:uncharacterized protein n=1 Tax=Cardiocondyla obscurior TaxID=286306 RepID=UPI0039657769